MAIDAQDYRGLKEADDRVICALKDAIKLAMTRLDDGTEVSAIIKRKCQETLDEYPDENYGR